MVFLHALDVSPRRRRRRRCTLEGTLTLKQGDPHRRGGLPEGRPAARAARARDARHRAEELQVRAQLAGGAAQRPHQLHQRGRQDRALGLLAAGHRPVPRGPNTRSTTYSRTFTREGPVHIQCNVHETMAADVLVLRSAAFTRPDAKGNWRTRGPRAEEPTRWWCGSPNGGGAAREVAACGSGALELDLTKKAPPPALRRDGTRYRPEYEDATF